MARDMGYIPTERGALEFPWGKNRRVIEVFGVVASDTVEAIPFQGPGMAGQENFATNPPKNEAKLLGVYTASNEAAMLALAGLRGTATIQFGGGETWSGEVLLVSSKIVTTYLTKEAALEMTIKFIKATTVTRIPAGT